MLSNNSRLDILGCPVDNYSLAETLEKIGEFIHSGKPHQHVVVNVDKLLKLRRDDKLKEIISDSSIINPDGMAIVWAAKILGRPLKERIAGVDLMVRLVQAAQAKGYKLYFLGAKEEVVEKVVQIYRDRYPGIKIVGFRNGYWSEDEEAWVVEDVRRSKADILFVGLSSPKKEFFIQKYMQMMGVPFCMGVGGSFDVVAGITRRAPNWMQRAGLEWFWRFLQEPARLWKRYLAGNAIFIALLLQEAVKEKFRCRLKN